MDDNPLRISDYEDYRNYVIATTGVDPNEDGEPEDHEEADFHAEWSEDHPGGYDLNNFC